MFSEPVQGQQGIRRSRPSAGEEGEGSNSRRESIGGDNLEIFKEIGGFEVRELISEKVTDPEISNQKDGWKGHHGPRNVPVGYILLNPLPSQSI